MRTCLPRRSTRPSTFLFLIVAIVAATSFGPRVAAAQSTFGTLTGTVTDASNAVLPGASVVATNIATGVERAAVSDAAGEFQMPNLDAGTYRVRTRLDRFADQTRDVELLARQILRTDIQLAIAGSQEAVQVTATRPVIESERPTIDPSIPGADTGRRALNL